MDQPTLPSTEIVTILNFGFIISLSVFILLLSMYKPKKYVALYIFSVNGVI